MGEMHPSAEQRERERSQRLATDIYVIRHGSANKATEDARPYRERDFERELSAKGWDEARATGKAIAEELRPSMQEGAIFMLRTSPLKRAEQTLEGVGTEVTKALELGVPEDELPFPPRPGQHQYEQPPIDQPHTAGSALSHEKFSRRPEATNQEAPNDRFSYRDSRYAFSNNVYDPHTKGMERFGGRGGKDWKAGATLPEEWVRDPGTLDEDLRAAGIHDVSARDILDERTSNFTNLAHVWASAAATLRKRWEQAVEEKTSLPKGFGITETQPPHLVVMAATHGAIVYESWLHEIIKKHEAETGEMVSPSLGYAEYFRVHIPTEPDETPTLHIHGKTIPVAWEMFGES